MPKCIHCGKKIRGGEKGKEMHENNCAGLRQAHIANVLSVHAHIQQQAAAASSQAQAFDDVVSGAVYFVKPDL